MADRAHRHPHFVEAMARSSRSILTVTCITPDAVFTTALGLTRWSSSVANVLEQPDSDFASVANCSSAVNLASTTQTERVRLSR